MLIGAMNNPMKDVVEEIEGFASDGFDFIDLTLEPDLAYSANIPVKKIKQVLEKAGLALWDIQHIIFLSLHPFPNLGSSHC